MATIPQYITVMRNAAWDIALRCGVDLQYESKGERAMLIGVLGVQAVLIDIMVKKGLVTDQQLLAAINAVRSSDWQPGHLPDRPEYWDTTPVTGV